MPLYTYRCPCGLRFERFLALRRYRAVALCLACGNWGRRVISAPLMVSATPDICYDSPIDGRPITSMQARTEDLARNNCQPYDPEMRTDYQNRIKDGERKLDKAIDESVEEAIAKMPTAQRGRLYSELDEQHLDLAYARTTKES